MNGKELGRQPAAPFSQITEVYQPTQHAGTTKREAFVKAALTGSAVDLVAGHSNPEEIAHAAARIADAALDELAKDGAE